MVTKDDFASMKAVTFFNNLIKAIIDGGGVEADLEYTYNGIPVHLNIQLLSVGSTKTELHPDFNEEVDSED